MRFLTALRQPTIRKLEMLESAHIVVGIPTYMSANTVDKVISTVCQGLHLYFPDKRSLIFVSDGGSTDDTREVARSVDVSDYEHEKIVAIYRGLPGKGSALRAVFEAATFLDAEAVALFDADLRSITPEWVRNILQPVLKDGYDYITPYYRRYKYDGTITNTVVYPLVRALFGKRIRQPIGGDFGLSSALAMHYAKQKVWETDVARFGIDIWMTINAITGNFRIAQTRLGAKIHNVKDPAKHLSDMFRQVVGTIFSLLDEYEDFWMAVKGSEDVPIIGEEVGEEPQPFDINVQELIDYFKLGFQNFGKIWESILEPEDYEIYERLAHETDPDKFVIPNETWARTVYRYAAVFHSMPRQRFKVLNTLIPLYNLNVANIYNRLKDADYDEAEAFFDSLARTFEDLKGYFVGLWRSVAKGGATA
ncbi:MAG: glycosyltransferase [Thermotogae bacterium]|nr:glycosyltransferase [Thermotogota bacterium]